MPEAAAPPAAAAPAAVSGEAKESSPQSVPEADPASSEVGPWERDPSSHSWAFDGF